MRLSVKFVIALVVASNIFFTSLSYAFTISGTSEDVWQVTASVPLIKMRQGEEFKLFDGAGGGVKYSPWVNETDSPFKALHFSGLLMVSTSTEVDSNNPSDREQTNVFSVGLVIGYDWLQLGVGRDIITSESQAVFDAREKTFFMLNLGGSIKF